MNFYIGDMHLGHANCIKHDSRPFTSVEEMDKALIENWNSRINSKNDDVFIVGDFVFRSDKTPDWYLKQLKGTKHFIIGNHDKATLNCPEAIKLIASMDKMMHVSDGKHQICVCHYPLMEWYGMYKGHYHIFAHIHANLSDTYYFMKNREKALNAGCMLNNYMPVTFNELKLNNEIFRNAH